MSRLSSAVIATVLLATSHALAVELEGVVTEIRDGDSLRLANARQTYNVRLADIDAPEMAQDFGKDSRTSLHEMCLLKRATVEAIGEDRFGRTLGRVRCLSIDANTEQVRRGMAWVFVRYAPKTSPLYAVQDDARAMKRGLWASAEPVAPWDYRRAKRLSEVAK